MGAGAVPKCGWLNDLSNLSPFFIYGLVADVHTLHSYPFIIADQVRKMGLL